MSDLPKQYSADERWFEHASIVEREAYNRACRDISAKFHHQLLQMAGSGAALEKRNLMHDAANTAWRTQR